MAKAPEKRQVLFNILARDYGALDFQDMLADYIAQLNHPGVSKGALQAQCTQCSHSIYPCSGISQNQIHKERYLQQNGDRGCCPYSARTKGLARADHPSTI